MPDERKAILLRISPALWTELSRWAQDDLRSLNGQIEYLLRESLARRGNGPRVRAGSEITPPEGNRGDPEHRQ